MGFPRLSTPAALALLRIVIGWHFLYEGVAKLIQPAWTSVGYLKGSTGPVAGLLHWLAADPARAAIVDQLNIYGLTLIGFGLVLGVLTRYAALAGIGLLALYYAAYPPLFGALGQGSTEGSYLLVNKNLIELCGLLVVLTAPVAYALDNVLQRRPVSNPDNLPEPGAPAYYPQRRAALASFVGLPVLGGLALAVLRKHGWKSLEEVSLCRASGGKDVYLAGASTRTFRFATVSELRGELPTANIGKLKMSRMILGGNLIGGWAHARDLIYVSKLVKAYHHREKIFETLALAEKCGVNTLLTNPALCGVVNDYWRNGGRIRFISDCGGKDVLEAIQKSIDTGAAACYIQGGVADELVKAGNFDAIARGLERIRKNGLPAGIGAHKLSTVQACVERGLRGDFWMKTLHRTNYWSAASRTECDNIWCDDPAATAAYMRTLSEPWIAFKVLAAGAIHPKDAFRFAFESGADFICVGMYDFQMVEDVNLAIDVLKGPLVREREWRA